MGKAGIRGSRLVLVVLATALAAGLLTSVIARPEPALTASEECYGFCRPSVTELLVSPPVAFFGFEHVVSFMVIVRTRGEFDQPTGQVVVKTGARVLCTIELHDGEGSCSPTNRELAPGGYSIVAHYSGNSDIRPSTSPTESLIILGGVGRRSPRAGFQGRFLFF
jgi:hypothetical protein